MFKMSYNNSIDVIKKIVTHETSIEKIQLVEFDNYELIQNRIDISEELKDVFNSALALREKYKIPFWDSFNVSLFNKELTKFDFFNDILFQNISRKTAFLARNEALNISSTNFQNYTALSSIVYVNSEILHMPLLDFHIPVNLNNETIAINVIKHLGLKGYLLDSGKSYHFIGSMFLTEIDLKFVLYKALLFTPIIDRAWISHQLLQGYCCLRITKKYDRLPILVSIIE